MDDPIVIEGKPFINLASNNYIGLATDSYVKEKMTEALEKYGASLCGTPIATGYVDLFKKLEELKESQKDIAIKWYFEEDDEDMEEAGQDFQAIINVPMELISVESL